jgi:autotransporter translocation and assembly factor TamB
MTSEAKTSRKWPRRLLAVLAILAILIFVLLATARLAMRSSWGLGFAERKIEAMAPAGQSIELSGLKGDLLGEFSISELTVSDANVRWMSAKDVKISWSFWALLRRDLIVNSLSASAVSIDNKPIIMGSGEPLNLPFKSYALNAFNIPQLSLSEAVIGRDVVIQASGKVKHGQDGGALALDGRTLNATVEDSADIDLTWSPEFLLSGDAKIIGESGGLISELLNLGSKEALTLDVKTSGQQDALTTTVDGRLGNRSFVTGEIKKFDDRAVITAQISPKIIPKFAKFNDMLGGAVNLAASIDGLNQKANFKADINTPKLEVDLAGKKTSKGFIFPELNIIANSPLSIFPDSPASVAALRMVGSGKLEDDISFTGQIAGDSLKYNDYALKTIAGPLSVKLNGTLLDFDTDLTGEFSDTETPFEWGEASPKILAQGQYNLETKRLSLKNSNINLQGLKLSAKGEASLAESTADMSGVFDVNKNVLGKALPASLKGTFKTETLNGKIALDISGDAAEFDALPEPLPQLIGSKLAFTSRALIGAGGVVDLKRFSAAGDNLRVSGTGRYSSSEMLKANIDYELGAFDVGSAAVTALDGTADISGAIGALKFDIATNAAEIMASKQTFSDVSLKAKGTQQGGVIKSVLDLNGQSSQGVLSFTADASYADSGWDASNIQAALSELKATGDVSGVGGDLTQLRADLNLSGDPSQFLPAKSVALDIKLSDSLIDAEGNISSLSLGPLSGAEVSLDAEGPRDAVRFNLALMGESLLADVNRPLDLQAIGIADMASSLASVTADLSGKLGQYELTSTQPIMMARTPDGMTGNGAMNLFGGTVSFEIDDQPQSLDLSSENLKLADVMILLGRPAVEGRAAFDAKMQMANSGFEGDVSGKLSGIRQPGSDAEVLDAELNGSLKNGQLAFTAKSTSGALSGGAQLNGALATSVSPPFVTWPPATPLQGEATANGNIGSLMELFLPPETNLSGNVNLDMRYSLPLEARGMTGTMSLTGGGVEQGSIGLTLKDLNFRSAFEGTTISVTELSAKDDKGGSLTGTGQMDVGFASGSAITLAAKKLHIFNRREGFAVLTGDLKLNHTGEKLALKGGLIVDDAQVSIDRLPRAGRPTLDVKFSDPTEDEEKPVRTATELDVKITSPSRIALRGRGVNASMSLDAHVTGAFNDPVLAGEAAITRGRFNFLGKRFALNDSKVMFNDDIMESRLEVAAIRETPELTATIKVTGTLSRPEIDLESTPELPEDEVISRILFGRSASQLTAIETARLAAALAQLSGGGGLDLMGGLENALGLDTLDFGQSATGQTQLTTGKYLSDNVYVEVRGSAEGTPGIAVEWTPRKNISVEAETAPGDTQRVSVQWQKDFD